MVQKTILFFLLLSAAFTAQAQVDTVRASTLPGPQLAEKAYNNGLASFNAQSYPAALRSFDQAILAKADFAAAYTNRAATCYELKEYPQALADYDQALKLEPGNYAGYFGWARAQAVVAYLTQHGIAAARLTAAGYGETRPEVPNTSKANRQLNRRTEFKVTAK